MNAVAITHIRATSGPMEVAERDACVCNSAGVDWTLQKGCVMRDEADFLFQIFYVGPVAPAPFR